MIHTLTFADALAARLAETLKGVPADTRPRVDVIGLVAQADVWREHEQDMGLGWDDVPAETGREVVSGGRTPVEHKRLAFLGVLPTAARYLRRRLRRQVGWSAGIVIIVVTDQVGDQVLLTSQQVNNDPLPAAAYEYLRDLGDGLCRI